MRVTTPIRTPSLWKTISARLKAPNPEQLVAVLRPEDRRGGDPGRVVVGKPGEDAGADDRQKHRGGSATQQQVPPPNQAGMNVAARAPARMRTSR